MLEMQQQEREKFVTYSSALGSPEQGRPDSGENFSLVISSSSLSQLRTWENFQKWALTNKHSSEQSLYLKLGLGDP